MSVAKKYKVGDVVSVNYGGIGGKYPCRITAVNNDATVDVLGFDTDLTEKSWIVSNMPTRQLQPAIQATTTRWAISPPTPPSPIVSSSHAQHLAFAKATGGTCTPVPKEEQITLAQAQALYERMNPKIEMAIKPDGVSQFFEMVSGVTTQMHGQGVLGKRNVQGSTS